MMADQVMEVAEGATEVEVLGMATRVEDLVATVTEAMEVMVEVKVLFPTEFWLNCPRDVNSEGVCEIVETKAFLKIDLHLQDMEVVEITMTLETMVVSSQTMGP